MPPQLQPYRADRHRAASGGGVPTFGALLKRLRTQACLSQEALAERAGISAKAVSALESGARSSPYLKTVDRLAQALGVGDADRAQLADAALLGRAKARPFDALPHALAPLVGRERETADVAGLLESHRLVTVTGPGGIGKTSLSISAARASSPRFSAGVAFCDLSTVSDATRITTTVAAACRVSLGNEEPTTARLIALLEHSARLLVLDNCEQIVEPIAAIVAALLRGCPDITILTTSRRRLGLPAEAVYKLPPLQFPSEGAAAGITAAAAQKFGAVALLLERAADNPAFVLSDQTAPYAATVCRQLDGLPLAIELAAAQLRFMSVEELSARLQRHLPLIDCAVRRTEERHNTLHRVFEWSYNLLSEREQSFFRALGIFAGSFTIDAARSVWNEGKSREREVLELIAGLVDSSQLVVEHDGHQTRYRLLETTRAYALEKALALGEQSALSDLHLEYVRSTAGLTTLWTEIANVRAALRWSLVGNNVLAGADLLAKVGAQWHVVGLVAEGFAWLDAFLEAIPSNAKVTAARLLTTKAFLADSVQRHADGLGPAREAVNAARSAADPKALFDALRVSGCLHASEGDFARAQAELDEAALILGPSPEAQARLMLLNSRGRAAQRRKDFDAAAAAFLEARSVALAAAQPFHAEAATLYLAEAEFERGAVTTAAQLLSDVLTGETFQNIGTEPVLASLAGYAIACDDVATTRECARRVCDLVARRHWSSALLTVTLEHAALAEALERHFKRAALLAGYCEAWYRSTSLTRHNAEQQSNIRLMARLRENIVDERLSALLRDGARLTAEMAARLAMNGSHA